MGAEMKNTILLAVLLLVVPVLLKAQEVAHSSAISSAAEAELVSLTGAGRSGADLARRIAFNFRVDDFLHVTEF